MRNSLFGACVALPMAAFAGHAMAAQPDGGRYVYVPPGAVAILVPTAPVTPADFPVARMIAQQETLMHRMMADMDSLLAMPMPDPQQMIRSVMNGIPQAAPGSSVVMTSISTGNGTCSETITYGYPARSGQPQVHVTKTGNACGAIQSSGPVNVTEPRPQPIVPHQRLWEISNPPHPIPMGAPPRT